MESKVFNIEVFDMSAERISVDYPATCILGLHNDYIGVTYDYNSEEAADEDKLIWEPKKWRQVSAFRRDQMSAVHFFYMNTERCWRLQLEFTGADIVRLNFKKRAVGNPIFEVCRDYMLSTNKQTI